MFDSRDELIHTATYIFDKNNTMDELYHHGILGMKLGVRRYQNEDGTRTEVGKKRYSNKNIKQNVQNKNDDGNKDDHKAAKTAAVIGAIGALTLGAAVTIGAVKVGRIALDGLAEDPNFRDIWGSAEYRRSMNHPNQRAFMSFMDDVIFKNTSKPPIHGVPAPQYNMLRNSPRLSAQKSPLRLTKQKRRRTAQDYIDGTY